MIKCRKCGLIQRESATCLKCGSAIKNHKIEEKILKNRDLFSNINNCINWCKNWINFFEDKLILPAERYSIYNMSLKDRCARYARRTLDIVIRLIILLIVTIIGYTALLYFGKVLWFIYLSTDVGQHFTIFFAQRANFISTILSMDPLDLSMDVSFAAFFICLIIGIVSQLLCMTRYLFVARSLFIKIVFWGLSLTGVVAGYLYMSYEFEQWEVTYCIALFPTMCLFAGCLQYMHELIPEIGDIIKSISRIKRVF